VCNGNEKPTNIIRQLMDEIHHGVVPSHWLSYYDTEELIVSSWMSDFMKRLLQLQNINHENTIWLGGLFFPGAFVAATRQQTAKSLNVSLEELSLEVKVGSDKDDKNGYIITGLILEGGAVIVNGGLQKSRVMRQKLPQTLFLWIQSDEKINSNTNTILPLYVNSKRHKLVLPVTLNIDGGVEPSEFSRRGTALISWAGE
jgi:dynein heavy chain 1, cytosolic